MSIEVGSKLRGKVTGITKFGAFVEVAEGVVGLVHISEVAANYVKDINEHLTVGDEVEVKVLNVEKDGKIGLSIKQAVEAPKQQRPQRPHRAHPSRNDKQPKETFEQKMNKFLKDSEDRLTSLKRNTESKRGGRGARRG
ncbi:MAG: S1 domain-containing RNA-binding protein [Bacilli bacterium]